MFSLRFNSGICFPTPHNRPYFLFKGRAIYENGVFKIDSNVFLHHLAGTSQKATELLERVESDEIYWVNRSPSNSAATFLSYYREFENMEVIEILRRIERKLEKIDEKIENFMGFCELSEEELELIDKDIDVS